MNWDRAVTAGGRGLFVVLWLVVAALALYAAARFHYVADWTANGRNSLSRPSVHIVRSLHAPVEITAFARGARIRQGLDALIAKYRRVDSDIHLKFVNPDKHPALVRHLDIGFNGELEIRYQGRQALVSSPSESGITNALARLERTGIRRLTFLTGNGERRVQDQSGLGLSSWARELRARGFTVTSANISKGALSPQTQGVVVIADPRVRFLAGEVTTLQDFVKAGGNLLIMLEPGHAEGLSPLLVKMGMRVRKGYAVDPASSLLTGASPDFIAIRHYPNLGPVRGMHLVTVFPTAAALALKPTHGLKPIPILATGTDAWTQEARLAGLVSPPPGITPSALTIGAALERPYKNGKQRLVVLGDSDFAANSYIGEGGNLALAMNLANWLAHDDAFINLPNRASPDLTLTLTSAEEDVIAFGFLLVLPLLLLGAGVAVWWRRRRL
ncbi:GldG family protein [Acidiferrobacter thiooxydans]|uniref:DUF4350 domain-containing protein n=1 Tax=Acidiferrobacter thiooxydans TaxID=163359 RepID=A0A368HJS2_9GAMM|nr:DUF4350 domain-containing protein [Acidiferrobacter thiooxydans]RCN58540.1 hypothetical protein C4900_01730 [Acidiferrobacter thiooxydans]